MSFDEQAWRDSFLLSNAVPQNPRMNSAEWRRLENRVRHLAETADSVTVVTGAIFSKDTVRIGAGGVAVPTELYKVILVLEDGRGWIMAAILPNTGSRGLLESFAVPVTEAERKTGLKFFRLLGERSSPARKGRIHVDGPWRNLANRCVFAGWTRPSSRKASANASPPLLK